MLGTGFAGYHCLRTLERRLPEDTAELTRPGEITPMTAQHAQRQGRTVGINVAASLGHGRPRRYRHRDLGFVVDLGGSQAVADPLHVPMSGLPAKAVAAGYHLLAMPANPLRVLADWCTDLVSRRQPVHFGIVPEDGVRLADADRLPRPHTRAG